MLQWLSTAHVYTLRTGQVRSIGGPRPVTRAVLRRCLGRMKAWVFLAQKVLDAEFPQCEAVQALEVFNVKGDAATPDMMQVPLQRLAQTFALDSTQLAAQWLDFRDRARYHAGIKECTNLQAWQAALLETRQRPETNARHPQTALASALARYAATSISDSGIERLFSRSDACIPQSAHGLSSPAESIRVTLLKLKQSDFLELAPAFSATWQQWFRHSVRQGLSDA